MFVSSCPLLVFTGWLYCQTPDCLNQEDIGDKEDNPDGKAAEQRSSCSPTDGLNLLADLALCATSEQLPSQPEQAHESLKTSFCKNADGVIEQESVLHSLLRQPAARTVHFLQSPPPRHHVGAGELAGLITKEHAYSMHPSTSLLLGFSSMPFQVYPLSGCTRLLYRHQTQDLTVDQEDKSNPETPECLEDPTPDSRRFKRSRTFVIKDGSVQVTRRWKRNYDFGLDSKFSNDPHFRTICRALHGYVFVYLLKRSPFLHGNDSVFILSFVTAHGTFQLKTPVTTYDSSSTCGSLSSTAGQCPGPLILTVSHLEWKQ